MPIEYVRGLVRPIVTVSMTLATVAFVAFAWPVPDKWWESWLIVLVWWFASRQRAS